MKNTKLSEKEKEYNHKKFVQAMEQKQTSRRFNKRMMFLQELDELFTTYLDVINPEEMYLRNKLRFEVKIKMR